MYKVIVSTSPYFRYFDVLQDPFSVGNQISKGEVKQLFNGVNTATFTIPFKSSKYNQLEPINTFVRVFDTEHDLMVFDGRITNITTSIDNLGNHYQTIDCEDALAFLHDSTQKYRKVQNTTVKDFFEDLISYHNEQVDEYKRFKIGKVTVKNNTDNVYRYTDDLTDTFDTLKDKLISRLGGYLIVRRDGHDLVLDYLAEYGEEINMPIKLGANLKSAKKSLDVTQLITRLVPIGAEIDTGDEQDSDDAAKPKITISSVNDGRRYLQDDDLVKKFGVIQKSVEWNKVNDPNILKSKGIKFLKNQRLGILSWDITVLDISMLDARYQSFKLGNSYPIIDEYLGITEFLKVIEKTIDVLNPHIIKLTVGTKNKTFTQYQIDYKANYQSALNRTPILPDYSKEIDSINKRLEKMGDLINSKQSDKPTTPTTPDDKKKPIKPVEPVKPVKEYFSGNIIDVSEHQGRINWPVMADNTALAIIRIQDGADYMDHTFKDNIKSVISNNINYAVYAFFRGQSIEDAENEARVFYNRVQNTIGENKQPRFYAIDIETIEMSHNISQMRNGVEAYVQQLEKLGIPRNKIVFYVANHLYDGFNLNIQGIGGVWIPSYGINDGTIANSRRPNHDCDLWQYSSVGRVNGINGNVDINTALTQSFKDRFLTKEV